MLKRHINLAENLLDDPVARTGRLYAKTLCVFTTTRWPNTGAACHFTSSEMAYIRPSNNVEDQPTFRNTCFGPLK
jgi:hypothetical protein